MKKKLFFSLAIIAALLAPYFVSEIIPGTLNKIHEKKIYWDASLSVKQIKIGQDLFEYAEGGKGPTVILLHGFQSDKKSMIGFATALMHKFHVILPDLSGHGGSSMHIGQHYDIRSLAKDLNKFIYALHLKDIHLIGTSTGGGVSVCCYLDNKDMVKTITLINPLGVKPPINSVFQNALEKGKNLLFPSTLKEFDEFGCALVGKPFPISNYLKKYFLQKLLMTRDFFQSAFAELIDSKPLDDELKEVNIPVLIIGARNDQILHYTSYDVFHKNIDKSEYVLLEDATHVLVGDAVKEANIVLDKFLSAHTK
jgi:pimeloyl-ACP methyl ester carboxylesterase